ncbi:MAG: Hsp20/alpha crystallin family protein, partial [Methylotenera sp.]
SRSGDGAMRTTQTKHLVNNDAMLPMVNIVGAAGAIDASKTVASLKDGILEITLPKLESSKRRTITVQ